MEVEEAHLALLQQAVLSSEALEVEEVAVKVVELILHFVASLVVVVEVVALALAVAG